MSQPKDGLRLLDYHGGGIETAQPGKLAGEPFALAGKTRNQIGKALALDGNAPLETVQAVVASFQRRHRHHGGQPIEAKGRLLAAVADNSQRLTLDGFTHGAKWGATRRARRSDGPATRAPRKSAAPVENGPELRRQVAGFARGGFQKIEAPAVLARLVAVRNQDKDNLVVNRIAHGRKMKLAEYPHHFIRETESNPDAPRVQLDGDALPGHEFFPPLDEFLRGGQSTLGAAFAESHARLQAPYRSYA